MLNADVALMVSKRDEAKDADQHIMVQIEDLFRTSIDNLKNISLIAKVRLTPPPRQIPDGVV